MNRKQIEGRMRKLFGKRAYWEERTRAPDADEREVLRLAHQAAREQRQAADRRMADRAKALCAVDAEYQAALADWKAAGARMRDTQGFHVHRITAGYRTSVAGVGMYHVKGQDDTWPEVYAKLEANQGID